MKRFLDWLRFSLLSPEALMILLIVVAYSRWPRVFEQLGQRFSGKFEGSDSVFAIPLAALAFAVSRVRTVLFPDESLRQELKEWDGFQGLYERVIFAISLMAIATIAVVALRVCGGGLSPSVRGLLFALSFTLSIAPLPSLLLAELKVKWLCDKYSSPATRKRNS